MWLTGQPEPGDQDNNDLWTHEKLDRALVAGLILDVVLDQKDLPDTHQARERLIKNRIQDCLIQHLAGKVSLDRFRSLAQNFDGWFDFYYPLLVVDGLKPTAKPASLGYCAREPQAAYHLYEPKNAFSASEAVADAHAPRHQACLEQFLDNWLQAAGTDIPSRSHRKLTPAKLRDFLRQSGGRWFRLRDFERFINMDRKTAWDYLKQFSQKGLLCHNRKNSAAVRYCLAPSFLKVEADALRLALSLCLASCQEEIVDQVSDFLIATGGEPFALREWQQEFKSFQNNTLLDQLVSCSIIAWQELPAGSRFLRLHHRWLQKETRWCSSDDEATLMYQSVDSSP